jgi:hypothetical protein
MSLCTVYVPYINKVVAENIPEKQAFEIQAAVINQQQVVTWVIHEVKKKINFENLVSK